jgi:hypothetical protein
MRITVVLALFALILILSACGPSAVQQIDANYDRCMRSAQERAGGGDSIASIARLTDDKAKRLNEDEAKCGSDEVEAIDQLQATYAALGSAPSSMQSGLQQWQNTANQNAANAQPLIDSTQAPIFQHWQQPEALAPITPPPANGSVIFGQGYRIIGAP